MNIFADTENTFTPSAKTLVGFWKWLSIYRGLRTAINPQYILCHEGSRWGWGMLYINLVWEICKTYIAVIRARPMLASGLSVSSTIPGSWLCSKKPSNSLIPTLRMTTTSMSRRHIIPQVVLLRDINWSPRFGLAVLRRRDFHLGFCLVRRIGCFALPEKNVNMSQQRSERRCGSKEHISSVFVKFFWCSNISWSDSLFMSR